MVLVDTNVLLDVLQDDPQWADWSLGQLRALSQVHRLLINPIVYAELSLAFESVTRLDATLQRMQLMVEELPRPALFLAGRAFLRYRREGGRKGNVLPDFFIGAHAAVAGHTLLTRDQRRYRSYFPRIPLVAPRSAEG